MQKSIPLTNCKLNRAQLSVLKVIASNPSAANQLHSLLLDANYIEEEIASFIPSTDFSGRSKEEVGSYLANLETIRNFLREAAKTPRI